MHPTDTTTPVPCRRCGAPMQALSAHPGAAIVMQCAFCQNQEHLPADASQRVHVLTQRLSEIRAAQAALEAPALGIANLAETYPRTVAPGIALTALFVLGVSGRSALATLSSDASPGIWLAALMRPFQTILLFGTVIGMTVLGLRRYARDLRPLLEARPPRGTGLALRCRTCGGAIEAQAVQGAFVPCRYCGTANLLGATDAQHQAEQLQLEVEEHRARAAGHQPLIATAATRYQRWVYVATGAAVLLNVLFWGIGSAVFPG